MVVFDVQFIAGTSQQFDCVESWIENDSDVCILGQLLQNAAIYCGFTCAHFTGQQE